MEIAQDSGNSLPRQYLSSEIPFLQIYSWCSFYKIQNEQLRLSKIAQHVPEYTQLSVFILQFLLRTTYFPLKISRLNTLDLVYAGAETLILTLGFCEEVSIYNAMRLHLLNRSYCRTITSLNIWRVHKRLQQCCLYHVLSNTPYLHGVLTRLVILVIYGYLAATNDRPLRPLGLV
jgi:hypothetical protein